MKRIVFILCYVIVAHSIWPIATHAQSLFVPGGINYVRVGDLDVTGNQITVEALVTPNGAGVNIVSKHTGPTNVNYLLRPGGVELTTTNGYVSSPSNVTLINGQCYHVAFTYDGSSVKYYVNGCLASSTPHSGNLVQNNLITAIGDQSNCQCESWNGYIDEVRIWNVARTQAEIQANMYDLPTPTVQPGLMAYYKFDGNYLNLQGNAAWNGVPVGAPQFQSNAACQNVDLSFQNSVSVTNVSCNGGSDGSVTITSTGGHPTYTYSIDGVNYFPTNTLSNLPAGNAVVWARSGSGNGCVEQIPITLTEPTVITSTVTGTDPHCVNGNDGAADLTVNGGTPPYTYGWTSGSTAQDPNNLVVGNNTVTITDANGCTATQSVVLSNPTAITTTVTGAGPSCNGGNDGQADLTVNNGNPPFSYAWSSGSTLQDPIDLVAGNNTVVITDSYGCTANANIVLTEPSPVFPNASANYCSAPGVCDGGGFTNPSGGTPPYTYSWSNGQTTQTATGMCQGTHTVTVTDATGCQGSQVITVNVPACLTDVDFNTWVQAGQPANGNWAVQSGGSQVFQSINGNPTFFVTPVDYINVRMRGKMRTTDNDDDFMGVVFGFKNPLGASDVFDTWLFDWKQGTQASGAFSGQEGFTLNHAVGTIPAAQYAATFWGHTNTPQFTVVATDYGNNGWNQNTDHEIEVTFTINRAIILVDGDTIFDISDCFEPGRFGFYNYSQRAVTYSDFTYELFADFTIEDQQVCAGDTAHFTFLEQCGNSNNLSQFSELQWDFGDGTSETITNLTQANVNPTHVYQAGGNYTVRLVAKDTLGCRDTILKDISVFLNPVADFSFTDLCLQDMTQFTDATTQGDFAIVNWSWDLGDGTTDNQPNISHQYGSAASYNVRLVVGDSFGCVDTTEQVVQIQSLPQADFAPIDDCFSSDYPFQDLSSTTVGSIASWQWDFGDTGTSTDQNPTHTYAGFGQYDVQLIVLSDQGCGDTILQTIILHDNPIADIIIPTICQLEPMQFTDASTIMEGTIDAWNYSFGDNTSSVLQNPGHLYANAGPITLQLTVTSNFGCSGTVSIPSVVNPKPDAQFSTQNVCLSELMMFADQTALASGSLSMWEWDFGDGSLDVVQNPDHLYTGTGIFNVELMVESNQGCRDTTTQSVEVYQLPSANFNFSNVCLNTQATFTDASTSGSGTVNSWQWDLGDGTTTSGQGPINHYYQAPNDYQVELIVGTGLGCSDTLEQTITIHPMPVADFVADSVCYNQATSFSNLSSILTGTIVNNAWNFGFGQTSAVSDPTNVFPQTGYLPVFLTVTSDFGCKDTITKNIRVYVLPQPQFSHNDTCFEDDVQFVDLSIISEGTNDLFDWSFGDASSSTDQNPVHHYNAAGFYQSQLTVTSNYGCTKSVAHQVEIYPLPQPAFTPIPSEGCQPLTVTFNNETTIESGYFLSGYQWSFGQGQYSATTHPQTVYADSGFYDITLVATSTKGCDDTLFVANAVNVWPRPIAGFRTDKDEYILFFPRVDITDESLGASEWMYDFADGSQAFTQNPSHEYQEAGNYLITQTVNNQYGCDDEISVRVIVKPAITFYIPNTFTPNADGINETFAGNGVGLKTYEMWIYNRWGENLFYSADPEYAWDGTHKGRAVESGRYIYRFVIIDVNNEMHQYNGEVYLMK